MTDKSKGQKNSEWYSFSNVIAVAMAVFVIAMFFSPDLKARVIQGLMYVGFFQPDIPADASIKMKQSTGMDVAFKDVNGAVVQLSDLKGKVVFINFWATWCPPCIAEMPSIDRLHKKYKKGEDVVFLLVDVDRNFRSSVEFMKQQKLDLPLYIAETAIPVAYFSGSMPTTVILDKAGNIVFQHIGAADYDNTKVESFIDQLRQ
ncbi:MAG: TlpA family protein disulfide reductase [Pedobacter sp.]|nr:MAG: TlpA family protein disulfide reductase [Pedobacter sp.]